MDEINGAADHNTAMGMEVVPMDQLLLSIGGYDDDITKMTENDFPIFVATSNEKIQGAGAIASKEFIEAIYREYGDVWILPSSIHDLILVKNDGGRFDADALLGMVKEVNSTTVSAEDKLVDNVYFLDKSGLVSVI